MSIKSAENKNSLQPMSVKRAANKVSLKPMSSEVLTEVLRFVYTGEIVPENAEPIMEEILNAAEML